MKREDWLRQTPTEKVVHYAQRTIDRLDSAKARYDRGRSSGKIAEPIAFFDVTHVELFRLSENGALSLRGWVAC